MPNPWRLTPRQEQLLDAYIASGQVTLAAEKVGMQESTANEHLGRVKRRMGKRFLIHAVLEWDRWRNNGTAA
jgi:FixJ family two-component response regulator